MEVVILSVILCAAVSVLVSTIITCKVSEKIFNGALKFFSEVVKRDEENKQ